ATVLVIGSGGPRRSVEASSICSSFTVYVVPGNAGTRGFVNDISNDSNSSVINPQAKFRPPPPGVDIKDFANLSNWCRSSSVDLVFVGPEDPLSKGIADVLTEAGIAVFGPSRLASEIEWSKAFAKQFMKRNSIPTPDFVVCEDLAAIEAIAASLSSLPFKPLVAKASGLAAGKGVVVSDTPAEAIAAAKDLLKRCGGPILLEARVDGPELSLIGFSDGERVSVLPPARDRKRRLDGDCGPNTGGMGAAAPCRLDSDRPFSPIASDQPTNKELLSRLERDFLQRAIDGLRAEGRRFVGALYAGLIRAGVDANGQDDFQALEFNCRLGDPETQALMPLVDCDLYQLCLDCVHGSLTPGPLPCQPSRVSLAAVLVQSPYPASCPGRYPVQGLDSFANQPGDPLLAFHAGTACDAAAAASSGAQTVTAGGRVCNLVAVATGPAECRAALRAALGARRIRFLGSIGAGILLATGPVAQSQSGSSAYASSGVNVAEGDHLVDLIKPLCSLTCLTASSACLEGIGSFGAPYSLNNCGGDFLGHCPDPVLVSGVDGVGTKLLVAEAVNQWGGVGVDLVAMCVNDVLCRGARPLFFLDTYSCGRLDARVAAAVVAGVSDGCLQAGCALVGGETAEMPGMYARDSSVDLIGCCVGILGPLIRSGLITGLAHITGGGIIGNLPRCLPTHLGANINLTAWQIPKLIRWLMHSAGMGIEEACCTFNCGIGMLIVTKQQWLANLLNRLPEAFVVGELVAKPGVNLIGQDSVSPLATMEYALLDYSRQMGTSCPYRVALVISNVATAQGLQRATKAGVPTSVLSHKDYPGGRPEFDAALVEELRSKGVQLVAMAGFMRIVTRVLLDAFPGRVLNTHPSLLPAFKGATRIATGVRVTGCTAHFVVPEVDAGPIVLQAPAPVLPGDSEETLQDRVKLLEHRLFPAAVAAVARGDCRFVAGPPADKCVWSCEPPSMAEFM
uniref:phosphoribosylformylglycinamidine cyclo-ligase n=1 Tax=Macrostomum lignano TaxID=282301 RepID=A0A1I8HV28_9PLAT